MDWLPNGISCLGCHYRSHWTPYFVLCAIFKWNLHKIHSHHLVNNRIKNAPFLSQIDDTIARNSRQFGSLATVFSVFFLLFVFFFQFKSSVRLSLIILFAIFSFVFFAFVLLLLLKSNHEFYVIFSIWLVSCCV